jgi:hypothetical protein
MGLWDLRPGDRGLERVRTTLVDRYRELIASGVHGVGLVAGNGTTDRAVKHR